jgi:hypothetical protein
MVQWTECVTHTEPQGVRLPGYLIAFVLTVLLVSTTPIGTGSGVHQLDLVHPLFEHVHIVNGRVLTHDQLDAGQGNQPAQANNGPAFGAGSASNATDGGLGLTPTVPLHTIMPSPVLAESSFATDLLQPAGRREAPPDPPPLG